PFKPSAGEGDLRGPTGRPLKRAGIHADAGPRSFGSAGVAYGVEYVNVARCLHDKSVANAVIYLEYHDCTGFFIRQLYFLAAEHGGSGEAVFRDFAFLVHGQNVARGKSVARAAIQHDRLVLADQVQTI